MPPASRSSVLFVGLLLLLLLAQRVASRDAEPWWACVRDIGHYFVPAEDPLNQLPSWRSNPCGYQTLTVDDVRRFVYFASNNRSVAFAGDSTALRAYVYAVNTFLPPLNIPVIRKVADVPRVMTHVAFSNTSGEQQPAAEKGARRRSCRAIFYNCRYVSTAKREVEEAIANSNGGALVITVGNWDLNWKIQRNVPMPGLVGGVHNFEAAKNYWTTHVTAVMQSIATQLAATPADKRPMILFREQYLPNCEASRFASKKNKYRRCAPFVRPIVVPLYRRVLAAMAWSLNIPVIPMDHIFQDKYRYCGLSDGLHLDRNCMMTEQQHVWNVYRLLVEQRVVQGLLPSDASLPDARSFLDAKVFDEWLTKHDLQPAAAALNVKKKKPPQAEALATTAAVNASLDDVGASERSVQPTATTRQSSSDAAELEVIRIVRTAGEGPHARDALLQTGALTMLSSHKSWLFGAMVLVVATTAFSLFIFRDD